MKMWAGMTVVFLNAFMATAFTISFYCSEDGIVPIKSRGQWSISALHCPGQGVTF